jgi:UMF1 family MFS transporter
MSSSPVKPRSQRGAIAAFCLYDVADSAFATTIVSVLYNQYFVEKVAGGAAGVRILGASVPGATLFTWLISITMLGVAFAGPLLGAWSDAAGSRMPWLRGLVLVGAAATIALATVHPGMWLRGSLLFVLAYAAMALASVLYNAILPELANTENMGKVSGLAWGLGYLGGGIVLILNLAVLSKPARFGLADGGAALRACFAMAGIWWILLATPLLARSGPPPRADSTGIASGFRQVAATLQSFRRTPHFLRFMIAYLLYNDGVQTIVATASIFAASELGFAARDLVMLFLLIQVTAFVGAPAAGWLADRLGHKPVIVVHIVAFIAITIWARWCGILGSATREFWWIGGIGGLFLGGIQSVSRSLLARWVPEQRSGEIFGFFAVAGRFASALGPLVFGAMSWAAGGLRPAILSISVFFLIGGVILLQVDERKGGEELLSLQRPDPR